MAVGDVFDFGSNLDPDGVRDVVLEAINHLPAERHLAVLDAIDRGEVSIEDDHLETVAITIGDLTIVVDRSELVRRDD